LFSECPLLGASWPFIGPILKGSKGAIAPFGTLSMDDRYLRLTGQLESS
jgi:hypothetical protein